MLRDVQNIFSIFHDGGISDAKLNHGVLELKVEISYLAQAINPSYSAFELSIEGVSNLRFSTWQNDPNEKPQVLNNPAEIFLPELEILEGNIKGHEVEVVCNQTDPAFSYCGGELLFSAVGVQVKDQGGSVCSIDDLREICKNYWAAFSNKSKA
jgi:hypothetical protein